MNIAKIAQDSAPLIEEEVTPFDKVPWLRQREGELVRIIEALNKTAESESWSTLKTHVFDGVLESLERRMATESNRMPLNEREIYKLQGQIAWAKKYADLGTLTQAFKAELQTVRKQIPHGE